MLRVINKLTLDILKDIQKEKYVILQDEQGFGYNVPTKLLYDVVMNTLIEANEESIELAKRQHKAMEYINNHIHQETFTGYMDSYELKKLLKILEGEDE